MYKVFIDHKPIIFISKKDLSTNSLRVKSKEINSIEDGLRPLLATVNVDNPLYLTNKDPEKEIKRLFKSYKKIEAAGGIVKRKKSYLVIKRKGKWDIPKGRIDKGEEAEVAAVREIMEECGINGHEITDFLTTTYHVMKWNGRPAIKKTYWYMLDYDGPKETKPEEKEDITQAKWMKREDMLAIRGSTFGSVNDVLDAFVKQYPEE